MILYIALQLINVITSTIKYIATIKAKPWVAAVTNALSYTIGAVITLFLVQHGVYEVIIVTFFTNLIGVPIGKWIISKFEKEKLWIYDATVKCGDSRAIEMKYDFKHIHGINSVYTPISEDEMYSFKIFAQTKEESRYIKSVLNGEKAKYHIIESI